MLLPVLTQTSCHILRLPPSFDMTHRASRVKVLTFEEKFEPLLPLYLSAPGQLLHKVGAIVRFPIIDAVRKSKERFILSILPFKSLYTAFRFKVIFEECTLACI